MKYAEESLNTKIRELYPEIEEHHLATEAVFDAQKHAFRVTFRRGKDSLVTYIDQQDADDCMGGTRCISLGIRIYQFLKNFEDRAVFGRKAA